MKALFIANGIQTARGTVGVSGGDMRWLAIAEIWQKNGIDIHVLTQDAGRIFCKKFELDATFHNFGSSGQGGKMAYLNRAIHSFKLSKELREYDGLIYSTTELMYDVVPGAHIKRLNKESRFGVVAHWVPPLVRKNTPLPNSLMFYINNRVGISYARRYADVVFGVSGPTINDLEKTVGMPPYKLVDVACGVDLARIVKAPKTHATEYDAVFMKRFDGTKGVWDILDIWSLVVKEKPQARLILIGHGSEPTMQKIQRFIEQNNLNDNIEIYGPVYDFNKKIELLSRSKIFALPTYEENWAIVIGEAQAAGLPVICYDLPEIRPVWQDSIIWVQKGNKMAFAEKMINLLNDDAARRALAQKGNDYVQRYDWEPIALNELEKLKGAILDDDPL